MRKLLLCLALFIVMLLTQGSTCNTIVSKPQRYCGVVGSTEPYLEFRDHGHRYVECGKSFCTIDIVSELWLHNPTDQTQNAKMQCSYFVGEVKMHQQRFKTIVLPGKTSVKFATDYFVQVPRDRQEIGVDCTADFAMVSAATHIKFTTAAPSSL